MKIEDLKIGQTVYVKGVITDIEKNEILDLEIHTSENNFFVSSSDAIASLDQPKPEIPQLVAEWIEKYKEKRCRLYHALEHVFDDVELGLYIKQQEGDYTEIIAKAWLYGYTVKKEQLYTVEIPNPSSKDTVYYLFKNEDGQVEIGSVLFLETEPDDSWRYDPDMQLTEQEIRKDFEWAWEQGFAKEVTE